MGLNVVNLPPDEEWRQKMMRQRISNSLIAPTATDEYLKTAREYPDYSTYKPTTGRKIIAALAGLSGEEGARQRSLEAPFEYSTVRPWKQKMNALGIAAQMEMLTGQNMAEQYKNYMQGNRAIAQRTLAERQAAGLPGSYDEAVTGQSKIARARQGIKSIFSPGTGDIATIDPEGNVVPHKKMLSPDTRMIDAANIRAGAMTKAAGIRAGATKESAKIRAGASKNAYVSPSAQKTAQQLAIQAVRNKYGEDANDFFSIDDDSKLAKINEPESHWYTWGDDEKKQKFQEMKDEYDRAYQAAIDETHGVDDEDEDEYEEY